ncbi:5-methyltetrahydropteroyltriglutamate--homocysteine S-methyltransferase [Candidatus Vidania fulgoroideorum]
MIKTHVISFPNIGQNRELKFLIESFLISNKTSKDELNLLIGIRKLKRRNLFFQKKLDIITLCNFPYYDRILTINMYLGLIPNRFKFKNLDFYEYFDLCKGKKPLRALKWFNVNYHYMVPEFDENLKYFKKNNFIFEDLFFLKNSKSETKFPIIGPLSFILIGDNKNIIKKNLFKNIFKRYYYLIKLLNNKVDYIQIEEPILSIGKHRFLYKLFSIFYNKIKFKNIIFTTYFKKNSKREIKFFLKFNFRYIHTEFLNIGIKNNFSLGLVDGKNIWKSNYKNLLDKFNKINIKDILISTTCPLDFIPLSVELENLSKTVINWFSFAKEKIIELTEIKKLLIYGKKYKEYLKNRVCNLSRIYFCNKNKSNLLVKKTYKRKKISVFNNKILTTTIGSFPQTKKTRKIRNNFHKGKISKTFYDKHIKGCIKKNIKFQEKIDLDVLVHGEPERGDMVEFFCENFTGCFITKFGWVQSFGTRTVKPPIIYGNIKRIKNITTKWLKYAKSLTKKPIKGILTGPITIMKWSFIRNDIKEAEISKQIALAIRKEVKDIKKLGINIIQIDEPAFKECMPLRKDLVKKYLNWSIKSFKLCFYNIKNVQIHTHICYSNINKFDLEIFSKLDVDVISIESSRYFDNITNLINKKLDFQFGLGVYDPHISFCPSKKKISSMINKILKLNNFPIWINPDCGLKTRTWREIKKPLKNIMYVVKKFINFSKKSL